MEKLNEIAEKISNLTSNEAKEMLDILKDEYNIEPLQTNVMFVEEEVKEEVKTTFDVKLEHAGGQKLKIVKSIKALTSLSLVESKKLADSAPVILKEQVSEEEANQLKSELENLGATIIIL